MKIQIVILILFINFSVVSCQKRNTSINSTTKLNLEKLDSLFNDTTNIYKNCLELSYITKDLFFKLSFEELNKIKNISLIHNLLKKYNSNFPQYTHGVSNKCETLFTNLEILTYTTKFHSVNQPKIKDSLLIDIKNGVKKNQNITLPMLTLNHLLRQMPNDSLQAIFNTTAYDTSINNLITFTIFKSFNEEKDLELFFLKNIPNMRDNPSIYKTLIYNFTTNEEFVFRNRKFLTEEKLKIEENLILDSFSKQKLFDYLKI